MADDNVLVLITGASGFVGSHLAIDLAAAGHRVAAIGGRSLPCRDVRQVVESVWQCDLADSTAAGRLLKEVKPDLVIHCAALARAAECEENPQNAHLANVVATRNLLLAADLPIVFISTDLVFDGSVAPQGGFREKDPVNPNSVYARTKADAEKFVLDTRSASAVARICLVFGDDLSGHGGFLGWLRGSLAKGDTVKLFTDEWRTPIYTKDVSRSIAAILNKPEISRKHRIVHLAGCERVSRFEFGSQVASRFGFDHSLLNPTSVTAFSSPAPRSSDVSLSNQVLIDEFGVEPMTIRSALADML